MRTVTVDLGGRGYPILIGEGLLRRRDLLAPHLGEGRVVLVTSETVAPLYGPAARALFDGRLAGEIVLPDGEEHKNLATLGRIYDRLMACRADRRTTLAALGGGVVGDLTGFAAATWQRGVDFIQMPTTLLAQVDSSVGGKTGINHPLGKNMIGAFHQPRCVVADTAALATLPPRELKAGLAEALKYGLIQDADFYAWLRGNSAAILALDPGRLARLIRICCETKAAVVARDERERGARALLNLGHTFGHAIEAASGYGAWLHGEAVAAGMVMAADLSRRLGWLDRDAARDVRETIETRFGLPAAPPGDIPAERWLELMRSDKKARDGDIRLVLLQGVGRAVVRGGIDRAALAATLAAGDGLCR